MPGACTHLLGRGKISAITRADLLASRDDRLRHAVIHPDHRPAPHSSITRVTTGCGAASPSEPPAFSAIRDTWHRTRPARRGLPASFQPRLAGQGRRRGRPDGADGHDPYTRGEPAAQRSGWLPKESGSYPYNLRTGPLRPVPRDEELAEAISSTLRFKGTSPFGYPGVRLKERARLSLRPPGRLGGHRTPR
jgi:hypothetical protein